MRPLRPAPLAVALALALALPAAARADEPRARVVPSPSAAPQTEPAAPPPGGVFFSDPFLLRLNLRGGLYFRNDHGYYDHARVFAEPPNVSTNTSTAVGSAIPPGGGGSIEVGVTPLPRLSLFGSYASYTNGVSETESKLSLSSQRFGLDLRYAVLRASSSEDTWKFTAQIEASVGVGYYVMREDFLDRAIFDTTLTHSDHSVGERLGLDATAYVGPLGFVVGYAYHHAAASVSDRLGASVDAGGHEISLGLAFRY